MFDPSLSATWQEKESPLRAAGWVLHARPAMPLPGSRAMPLTVTVESVNHACAAGDWIVSSGGVVSPGRGRSRRRRGSRRSRWRDGVAQAERARPLQRLQLLRLLREERAPLLARGVGPEERSLARAHPPLEGAQLFSFGLARLDLGGHRVKGEGGVRALPARESKWQCERDDQTGTGDQPAEGALHLASLGRSRPSRQPPTGRLYVSRTGSPCGHRLLNRLIMPLPLRDSPACGRPVRA